MKTYFGITIPEEHAIDGVETDLLIYFGVESSPSEVVSLFVKFEFSHMWHTPHLAIYPHDQL